MATYKNQAIINYPVNEVFKVFKKTAKRDFPKFDEKKPVGVTVERSVGAYSVRSGRMLVEITDYKADEVYEITSSQENHLYKSRYEFYPVEENKTRLILAESSYSQGIFNYINVLIAGIFFKGRVKKRFKYVISGIENQIEENLKRANKVI
jgi:hypothetical protein